MPTISPAHVEGTTWPDVQPFVALVTRIGVAPTPSPASRRSSKQPQTPVSDSRSPAPLSAGVALRAQLPRRNAHTNLDTVRAQQLRALHAQSPALSWAFAMHDWRAPSSSIDFGSSAAAAAPAHPLLELGPDEVGTSPKSARVRSAKRGETTAVHLLSWPNRQNRHASSLQEVRTLT